MELIVFGLNHRTAPLKVRETWAISGEQHHATLRELSDSVENSEHVILSTCNRTEFYAVVEESRATNLGDVLNPYRALQTRISGHAEVLESPDEHFYVRRDEDAISHLFRLAGGA